MEVSQINILKKRAKDLGIWFHFITRVKVFWLSVNEDPEKTEALIAELKDLVSKEEGLKVPEDRAFYLRFLRAGLSSPKDGLEIIKNYFLLRKNHFKYFKVSYITVQITRVFYIPIWCLHTSFVFCVFKVILTKLTIYWPPPWYYSFSSFVFL